MLVWNLIFVDIQNESNILSSIELSLITSKNDSLFYMLIVIIQWKLYQNISLCTALERFLHITSGTCTIGWEPLD